MFICEHCNNEYKLKSNLTRHKRQKHFTIDNNIQNLDKYKNFNCDICDKNFSRNDYLKRHKLNCKPKNTELIAHQINNNQNNNLIIAPTQNNTTNNNNFNIIINTLGNENLAKLTHNEIDRIFDDEINGIITCVDYIYFNKNAPENHIFCTTAINDDYLSVYNTETNKVEKDTKKYFLDRVITLTIDKINTLFELHKKRFSKETQNQIKTNIETLQQMKLCSSNKRLIKELIRGLNLLSYNKKEIINRTWMGEQPEKLTFDEILDLEYGPDEILESSNETLKELIHNEVKELNMLTEDKKTNLKKPNKEKLLDMLNIPFIKPNKTEDNKKSKIRPPKLPFMKHKKSDSSSSSDSDSSSSSDSDSSSDKHKINNIEIIYNGTTYIFDNGNLYNKTKIGLKGQLFGTFKDGKIRPNEIEL